MWLPLPSKFKIVPSPNFSCTTRRPRVNSSDALLSFVRLFVYNLLVMLPPNLISHSNSEGISLINLEGLG